MESQYKLHLGETKKIIDGMIERKEMVDMILKIKGRKFLILDNDRLMSIVDVKNGVKFEIKKNRLVKKINWNNIF